MNTKFISKFKDKMLWLINYLLKIGDRKVSETKESQQESVRKNRKESQQKESQ